MPKPGCATNKGIDSAAKGFDEKAVRQSHSLQGIYGYFRRKRECPTGDLHCGAEKGRSKPEEAFFRADLSSSDLEEAIAVRFCHAPSWSSEFRVRFAGLHAEQSALQNRNADSPTNNGIFPTEIVCRAALGEVGKVSCGHPVIFSLPMVWFRSRRHAENYRLKNRSAYSNERGIPYL